MQLVLLIVRVVLALVFLAAAAGKLVDLAGSRRAMREFGLPVGAADVAGTLLPVGELAIAGALLITVSARWAGLAALLLLLVFASAIARAMRKGESPDCHCFGQLHSEPAGTPTLIRNGILAAAAVVILIGGAGRSLSALAGEDIALSVVSVALLALTAAAASLWQENRELRQRPAGGRRPMANPGLPWARPRQT